jgi:two-component system cell cycle sensor histidine kinase/response regulator CckA
MRAAVPSSGPRTAAARCARILIAEDEVSVRAYIDRVLRDAGYLTVRAVDGMDALDLATHLGPIDLLVTDELMPRMLGHDLARQLRKQNPDLRVLFVTGYSDRLGEEKPTWEKHEARLDKPVTPNELLGAVSFLLHHGPA